MKKFILILVLVPFVASAAWWNPWSWDKEPQKIDEWATCVAMGGKMIQLADTRRWICSIPYEKKNHEEKTTETIVEKTVVEKPTIQIQKEIIREADSALRTKVDVLEARLKKYDTFFTCLKQQETAVQKSETQTFEELVVNPKTGIKESVKRQEIVFRSPSYLPRSWFVDCEVEAGI